MDQCENLLSASTDSGILTAVANALEVTAVPTMQDLTGWLGTCPDAARLEASARLETVLQQSGFPWDPAHPPVWAVRAGALGAEYGSPLPHSAKREATKDDMETFGFLTRNGAMLFAFNPLGFVHDMWAYAVTDGHEIRHPLAPLVDAWAERPPSVPVNRRADRRILPVVRATVRETRPERLRAWTFSGLGPAETAQGELPLFDVPERRSVPILDLADSSGVPVMAKGRGAPLSLRLFVQAGLAVAPEDRTREHVRIALTVRDLRDGLFPGRKQTGRGIRSSYDPKRHWPTIRQALKEARDYTIRLPDGSRWFMFALRQLPPEGPGGYPDLDGVVVLDLAFPPGTKTGPVIDLPELVRMGADSGPRYRAYLAAHSLNWIPGVTRRPLPPGKRQWGWSRSETDYPVLTETDMRRLAFGENDSKHRTKAQLEKPWEELPGVRTLKRAVDPKTGEVGWRFIPLRDPEEDT